METLAAAVQAVRDWWAGLPAFPDVGIPAPGDPDVLIVISTVLFAVGTMGIVSAMVDKRVSWSGVFALLLAAALMFWAWEGQRDDFGWISIPEAFIEMLARVLR
ncbi:hypothetical protein [Jannaschia sp. 2305UL9-9]|uniref:hypothetical protein n=1 Tax=Jannaschia sp. 2305UL9-9 TaxID=3121638 RepID=UPI00352997C9